MARRATMLLLIAALAMAAQERVRLSHSRELRLSYTGKPEAQRMLASNTAQPAALATADFDEDGVPDLACGYRIPNGGLVTVQRGNVDAIYPNAPEAQRRKASGEFADEPFLSPGRIFEMPEPPDFLVAGDLDADGHWDLVAGALGSAKLYFLRGDGHGNFAAPEAILLPGAMTAMTGGEVNRPDGLTDLVVAVRAASGPRLLVFQGS